MLFFVEARGGFSDTNNTMTLSLPGPSNTWSVDPVFGKIEKCVVTILLQKQTLCVLHLSHCWIGEDACNKINLRYYRDTFLLNRDVRWLAEELVKNVCLTELYLDHNFLGDEDVVSPLLMQKFHTC